MHFTIGCLKTISAVKDSPMKTFDLSRADTVVIKVGSSLVTNGGHGVDAAALHNWAMQIAELKSRGIDVVFVSSGAIAEGIKRLGWAARPKALNELQAAAAVGQMGLAQAYEMAFAPLGIQTAQVLLTHEDLSNRTRYLNARSTLRTLLGKGVVPIINENDTVTIDEIKLGDNDTLGALVTNLIEADALIILTDQQGLYDSDPRQNPQAQLIAQIAANHPGLEAMAGGAGSSVGTGGMYTKIIAAKRAATSGTHTAIASGREKDVMTRLANGESVGTLLVAEMQVLNARKQWLADHLQLSGKLLLDAGAIKALADGKSLLPVGVVEVQGEFERGAAVACLSPEGQEVARGLINYSSSDARRIARHSSADIEELLGYVDEPEIIHRDNLTLS